MQHTENYSYVVIILNHGRQRVARYVLHGIAVMEFQYPIKNVVFLNSLVTWTKKNTTK